MINFEYFIYKTIIRSEYWCLFDFDSELIKESISAFNKSSYEFSLTIFWRDREDVIDSSWVIEGLIVWDWAFCER